MLIHIVTEDYDESYFNGLFETDYHIDRDLVIKVMREYLKRLLPKFSPMFDHIHNDVLLDKHLIKDEITYLVSGRSMDDEKFFDIFELIWDGYEDLELGYIEVLIELGYIKRYTESTLVRIPVTL